MPAVAKSSKIKPKGKKNEKQPLILSNANKKRPPVKEEDDKGIIYVKHLPHGFFEKQLRVFFTQFGDVTRVHVARSKKTLRSRGYAYVEFRYREVAQIAAETMNNYLMFGKILKTGILPAGAKRIPRKYEKAYDANGNETSTYKLWLKRVVARSNGRVTKTSVVNRNNRALAKLKQLKKKYSEMDVDYNVDDIIPRYDDGDIKKPDYDAEEEQLRARRAKKTSKNKPKVQKLEVSVQSIDANGQNEAKKTSKKKPKVEKLEVSVQSMDANEQNEDSSDDDEGSSFLPLQSTDWDVPLSDNEVDVRRQSANKSDVNKNSKSAAVKFAAKAKSKIDKEKNQSDKSSKRPPKAVKPKETEGKRKKNTLVKQVESTSPDKTKGAPKKKKQDMKEKKITGGIIKKSKVKKQKVVEKASSPLKAAAKVLIDDPNVRKIKAKNMKKKRKV